MSIELYVAYVGACLVFAIVPGPTVTLVMANSMRHGARAGLLNVAGAQLGVAVMIAIVGLGLASAVETLGHGFDLLRSAGAVYLIYLGVRMIRAPRDAIDNRLVVAPRSGFFAQGFLVVLSNPKALFFFGAFFPQFIDPKGDWALQIALMGATVMLVATLSDTGYALLAARAGRFLSRRRLRLLSRTSGGVLIGGGLWLAFARTR